MLIEHRSGRRLERFPRVKDVLSFVNNVNDRARLQPLLSNAVHFSENVRQEQSITAPPAGTVSNADNNHASWPDHLFQVKIRQAKKTSITLINFAINPRGDAFTPLELGAHCAIRPVINFDIILLSAYLGIFRKPPFKVIQRPRSNALLISIKM